MFLGSTQSPQEPITDQLLRLVGLSATPNFPKNFRIEEKVAPLSDSHFGTTRAIGDIERVLRLSEFRRMLFDASQIAGRFTSARLRVEAYSEIAIELARTGDFAGAELTITKASDAVPKSGGTPGAQVYSMIRVSNALVTIGELRATELDQGGANGLFAEALKSAQRLDQPWREDAVCRIAQVILTSQSRRLDLDGVLATAAQIGNLRLRSEALVVASEQQIRDGRLPYALVLSQAAAKAESDLEIKKASRTLSKMLSMPIRADASHGRIERALKLTRHLDSSAERAKLLVELAKVYQSRGDHGECKCVLLEANATIRDRIRETKSRFTLDGRSDVQVTGPRSLLEQAGRIDLGEGRWELKRQSRAFGSKPGNQTDSFHFGIISSILNQVRDEFSRFEDLVADFSLILGALDQGSTGERVALTKAIGILGNTQHFDLANKEFTVKERSLYRSIMLHEHFQFAAPGPLEIRRSLLTTLCDDFEALISAHEFPNKLHSKSLVGALEKIQLKEARDFLYAQARSVLSSQQGPIFELVLPRLLWSIANLNTHRGNDLLLSALTDDRLESHTHEVLVGRLLQNGYIERSVGEWLCEQTSRRLALGVKTDRKLRAEDHDCIRELIKNGIMPSTEILTHVVNGKWQDDLGGELIGLRDKLAFVAKSQHEFSTVKTASEALEYLADGAHGAQHSLTYYLLNSGKTRFELINNYSYTKFSELLSIARHLQIHPEPIAIFSRAMHQAGVSLEQSGHIIKNLAEGHFPKASSETPQLEKLIAIDGSDRSKLESANLQAAEVLGKGQLAVCLKTPLYREYLLEERTAGAVDLLNLLNLASTLDERRNVLVTIDQHRPDFEARAVSALEPHWSRLNAKLLFTTTVDNIFRNESNPIKCEELVWAVEEKRLSLAQAKQELIVALRGENPQIKSISAQINHKEKILRDIIKALERNQDNARLLKQQKEITQDIQALVDQRHKVEGQSVTDRYRELSPDERKRKIEEESKALRVLGDKDPAAIFTYLMMEFFDESALTEGDINLIKEISAHLEYCFTTVRNLVDAGFSANRPERYVSLRYLDKCDHVMTLARFADSRICCFSSSNYDMRVAHGISNKRWIASILRDPLSFVLEVDEKSSSQGLEKRLLGGEIRNNLGFVFGMFGINEDGYPVILLNGLYLSTGNEIRSAEAILSTIEDQIAKPVGAVAIFIAGNIPQNLPGYEQGSLQAIRLRALAMENGEPEQRVYDDMGSVANKLCTFKGFVKYLDPEKTLTVI